MHNDFIRNLGGAEPFRLIARESAVVHLCGFCNREPVSASELQATAVGAPTPRRENVLTPVLTPVVT